MGRMHPKDVASAIGAKFAERDIPFYVFEVSPLAARRGENEGLQVRASVGDVDA